MAFLEWLSNTAFPTWVRESETVWAYPFVLFLHSLGMAMLVGFISVIDVKLLGVRRLPLASLQRLMPIIWAGFWINAVTGVLLLVIAPDKLRNPVFWVKLTLIALGMINLLFITRDVFGQPIPDNKPFSGRVKFLGATSLVVWMGAITAGRLMAYIGNTR